MPNAVNRDLKKQTERARAEALRQLVKNAVECTYYVSLGEVMKRELTKQFGITEAEANYTLYLACDTVVKHIKQIEGKK